MLKQFQFLQDFTKRITSKNSPQEAVLDIWRYAEPANEEPEPLKRNILQWRRLISSVPDPIATFRGQPVDLVGFVQQIPTDRTNEFMLVRRVIRCCLADTLTLGLPVCVTEVNQFKTDSWIRIRGVFSELFIDGKPKLVIEPKSIEFIPEPQKSYINGVF